MKKVISLVLALLIPLLGCATTSPTERIAASIHAVEESEWVDLASPRRSPDSARRILDEATGSGRDLLRVFTSDGDTVLIKDRIIIGDYVSPPNLNVAGVQVVVEESIALEGVVRWQAASSPYVNSGLEGGFGSIGIAIVGLAGVIGVGVLFNKILAGVGGAAEDLIESLGPGY